MEAKELRIGNLVQQEHGKVRVGQVTLISSKTVCLKREFSKLRTSIDEIEPIPLTEEWLVKFGFVYQTMGIFLAPSKSYFSVIKWEDNDAEFTLIKNQKVFLKFVHQLQNLYFALTGEELTIAKTRLKTSG